MIVQLLFFQKLIISFNQSNNEDTSLESKFNMVEMVLNRIDYENKNVLKPFEVYTNWSGA